MTVASGVGATAALGTAPAANATCASVFGIGNTANCTSSFGSIAIATGAGAVASAGGLFGLAISVGTDAHSEAGTGGVVPINVGNIAINFGNSGVGLNFVDAEGIGNLAANLGGIDSFVTVQGVFSNATNLSGSDNTVGTAGVLSWAFNVRGSANNVGAGPGFLTIAGAVGRNGAIVSQKPFGININGAGIPPSTAAQQAALRNNRKPVAPKPVRSAHATGSGKGAAHSGRA